MEFKEYEKKAKETALYPVEEGQVYTLMGLANETGETLGKFKKYLRGDYPYQVMQDKIQDELGDVLWYLTMACKEFETSLEEVAIKNYNKLHQRQLDGVIRGDGDNR